MFAVGLCSLKCTVDADCDSNQFCSDQKCHTRCNSKADCASQQYCYGNVCQMSCEDDPNICSNTSICYEHQCMPTCSTGENNTTLTYYEISCYMFGFEVLFINSLHLILHCL